mmetsp:Transcript_140627/g.449558  ORF Transcript_140627/g.449558 Transcript_140627/m.449558 type:complete len:211 (-) Transcript_140627:954-1586(-)
MCGRKRISLKPLRAPVASAQTTDEDGQHKAEHKQETGGLAGTSVGLRQHRRRDHCQHSAAREALHARRRFVPDLLRNGASRDGVRHDPRPKHGEQTCDDEHHGPHEENLGNGHPLVPQEARTTERFREIRNENGSQKRETYRALVGHETQHQCLRDAIQQQPQPHGEGHVLARGLGIHLQLLLLLLGHLPLQHHGAAEGRGRRQRRWQHR